MGELERLGQSDEWANTLLWMLGRDGWTVVTRPALAGGVLVIACKGTCELRNSAATLAAAASPVFQAAARMRAAA